MTELLVFLRFPINLLSLFAIIILVAYMSMFHRNSKLVKAFSSLKCSILLSLIACVIMIIDGTWALDLHKSIIFVSILIAITINLLFVVFCRSRPKTMRQWLFLILHWGILLTLIGGIAGAPDKLKHKMIVGYQSETNIAYNLDTTSRKVDFTVLLEDFKIDYWNNNPNNPKEFTSEVTFSENGKKTTKYIKVNSPIRYGGYKIYQDSYDNSRSEPRYTVLLLVKDNWLPVTYTGLIMLILGGLIMIFWNQNRRKR